MDHAPARHSLDPHRRGAGAAGPARRRRRRPRARPTPSSGTPPATALEPVPKVIRVDIDLLQGVDRQKQILLDNTRRFARGLPANNALLWGARGMGKSLAGQGGRTPRVNARGAAAALALIEIHREDIRLAARRCCDVLRGEPRRCLIFCDDLSFERRGRRLQVAEVGAGGRHRGPAGQRAVLRHLQPPPPDAARHDRERALDRDQPVRGDRGEGLAVRPLRPVARLPQLRPGHLLRHDRGLCRPLRARRSPARRCAPRRSNGR